MSEKPKPVFYETITDMHGVPEEKVDAFCEDLRLWLKAHRLIERAMREGGVDPNWRTPVDRFGWIDDYRHDLTVNVHWHNMPAAAPTEPEQGGSRSAADEGDEMSGSGHTGERI